MRSGVIDSVEHLATSAAIIGAMPDTPEEQAARRRRAEARRGRMRIVKTDHGTTADASPVRGEEAMSLVWPLTRTSWMLAGRPFPTYTRAEIPFRFVDRPGDPSADD